jgi:hypothetical protein
MDDKFKWKFMEKNSKHFSLYIYVKFMYIYELCHSSDPPLLCSSGSIEKFRYGYEPVLDLWKSSGMLMKYTIPAPPPFSPVLDLCKSSGMFINQLWTYEKVHVCLWTSSGSIEKFRYIYEIYHSCHLFLWLACREFLNCSDSSVV